MPTKPLRETDPRAQPFDLPGGPDAVLLLHGYTGSPAEMIPLGQRLHERLGWHVSAPLLAGHGTTLEDLAQRRWTEWLGDAEGAFRELFAHHRTVHLAGLSMGALLALEIVRRHTSAVASLALFAPLIYFRKWYQKLIVRPSICEHVPWPTTLPKHAPLHPDQAGYTAYPVRSLAEFSRVVFRARTLPRMKSPPTFLAVSQADDVASPASANFLFHRLQNPKNHLLRLEKSIHVMTVGEEREKLFEELEKFYKGL